MHKKIVAALFFLLITVHSGVAQTTSTRESTQWWGSGVETALAKAGDRRGDWQTALKSVDDQYKVAMEFLVSNMPASDLKKVSPEFLLGNVKLAYTAREQVAWGKDIPESIFLNDVLPYCNVDEPRDPWRKEFYERFIELAKSCKTPAEAARKLNETAFKELKVKYSTKRKRANQSPKESIEQGLASCTGLSILLTDACRSVCVPSRLAGIAKWPNKQGNHTWVEVWDKEWYFAGAAEPGENGLNDAWFVRDAATAIKDSEESAIMAVSFAKTDAKWPMVWAEGSEQVSAVNVTDRYTKNTKDSEANDATEAADTIECLVVVRDAKGVRVDAVVNIVDAKEATKSWTGNSRNESADTNDILLFDLPKSRAYNVSVRRGVHCIRQTVTAEAASVRQRLDIVIPDSAASFADSAVAAFGKEFFSADTNASAADAPALTVDWKLPALELHWKKILWEQYRQHGKHESLREDFESSRVRSAGHESPWTMKDVGKRGPNGWPLFIAMHGGGGTAKRVNDSQWRHMQIYYRDQAQLPGYKYLALRAPNDTWNGFYDDYVYPLVHELIRQQVLFNDVDPNRVYIIGYSHGGYGAFAIGPKIPDHFAAIHSSAAAPTSGETTGETLANTRFTYMIGAKDTAYGRAERCQDFAKSMKEMRGDRHDLYPVTMFWKPNKGHGGLPDRDMIKEMYGFQRNPVPRELHWKMSDTVVKDFFWLSCDAPVKENAISATCKDNSVDIKLPAGTECSVWLDSRLVDFSLPVKVTVNGKPLDLKAVPSVEAMAKSMQRRGDLFRTFSCEMKIQAP